MDTLADFACTDSEHLDVLIVGGGLSGICAACKCRVVAGSVTMRSNQVLSEQQVRQGWTLACQAEPNSAELQVEY